MKQHHEQELRFIAEHYQHRLRGCVQFEQCVKRADKRAQKCIEVLNLYVLIAADSQGVNPWQHIKIRSKFQDANSQILK
jgi:hypothetical protein